MEYPTRKEFLLALPGLFALLSGCGSGKGSGSPNQSAVPPDQSRIRVRSRAGMVQLPPGARVSVSDVTVASSFGTIKPESSGAFSVFVNELAPQVVHVQNDRGEPVLLTISGSESGPALLNARSTARTMVFLHPLLAASNPADATRTITLIEGLTELDALTEAIIAQLAGGDALDPNEPNLRGAWETAVSVAVGRIQNGGRRRSVSPDTAQSHLVFQTLSDVDPHNVRLRAENYGLRWIDIWAVAVDQNDNALGPAQPLDLIEPAEAISRFSVVTGQTNKPSERDLAISIPSDAAAIRLEAWGPGFSDTSSVSWDEYWAHAQTSTAVTVFFEVIGPVIDILLGFYLVSESANAVREIQKLLDVKEFIDILRGFVDGSNITLMAYRAVDFMLTNDVARSVLMAMAAQLGIQGVAKTISSVIPWLRLINAILGAWELSVNAISLSSARPREEYLVTQGSTTNGDPFRVTLSWDQPNDIDLHTFGPGDEHSWYQSKEISMGELDVDDVDGFGPENFTARRVVPGRYRVAVNYYSSHSDEDIPTQARLQVRTNSSIREYGPYTLTVADQNGDYPIRGNSPSWWRPVDLLVSSDGSVRILAPDGETPITRARHEEAHTKKAYENGRSPQR